jgi:hypothetical protein
MLPPSNTRRPSSFNGPTPKEIQARADFEAHATERRTNTRNIGHLTRSSTISGLETVIDFPVTRPRLASSSSSVRDERKSLKRVFSLPEVGMESQVPFYKRVGVVPRDLKNGKNVKPAENIKLEPESKQLLRDKVIYFYPNDDVSMVRRMRIHKIIQLGAAWVRTWREDVTHVMVDDANHTYGQLLRHLNRAGFPVSVSVDPTTLSTNTGRERSCTGQVRSVRTPMHRVGYIARSIRNTFRRQGCTATKPVIPNGKSFTRFYQHRDFVTDQSCWNGNYTTFPQDKFSTYRWKSKVTPNSHRCTL